MKQFLKYAIGEIFLVVTGILIAFSINTWKAESNQQKKEDNVLRLVIEDLQQDTMVVNRILNFYKEHEYKFDLLLSDTLSAEILDTCNCQWVMTVAQPFHPNTSGNQLLQQIETDLKTPRDSLVHKTKLFYVQISPDMELVNKIITDELFDNIRQWRDTQPWFANVFQGKHDERYYDYMINDPIYKNKVANFHLLLYGNFLPALQIYQKEAEELSAQLTELLEEDN